MKELERFRKSERDSETGEKARTQSNMQKKEQ